MKKVHDQRNERFNQRLMEKWGYKRDDSIVTEEGDLEALGLPPEEDPSDAASLGVVEEPLPEGGSDCNVGLDTGGGRFEGGNCNRWTVPAGMDGKVATQLCNQVHGNTNIQLTSKEFLKPGARVTYCQASMDRKALAGGEEHDMDGIPDPYVKYRKLQETWGGNNDNENRSAVHGEKSLKGAEDYEPIFEEEICEECPERPLESPLAEMIRAELKKALLKRGE